MQGDDDDHFLQSQTTHLNVFNMFSNLVFDG